MPLPLEMQIELMHGAFANIATSDLSDVQVKVSTGYCSVDFNKNSDEIQLRIAARSLIDNIASLKDHLKDWCKENGVSFGGDKLINNNTSVAIVHDLWNIQKHRLLRDSPRSGIIPELKNYMTVLHFGPSDGPMSFQLDPATGQTNNQGPELILFAEVYDENGNKVGLFDRICREAVEAWHQELLSAGVSIPDI